MNKELLKRLYWKFLHGLDSDGIKSLCKNSSKPLDSEQLFSIFKTELRFDSYQVVTYAAISTSLEGIVCYKLGYGFAHLYGNNSFEKGSFTVISRFEHNKGIATQFLIEDVNKTYWILNFSKHW